MSRLRLEGRGWLLHRLARRAALDPAAAPGALEAEEWAVLFVRELMMQAAAGTGGRRDSQEASRNRLGQEYAARVAEVVSARYREQLTLAEVARVVGCSPFHLSRLVVAATGVPIHRTIVRRRLQAAVELLLETRKAAGIGPAGGPGWLRGSPPRTADHPCRP